MKKNLSVTKHPSIKISIIAAISLLMLIPLTMVVSLIEDRESSKNMVAKDVANSYAAAQTIFAPKIESTVMTKSATASNAMEPIKYTGFCEKLDYNAKIDTDVLHRSIYDVIVYDAKLDIRGTICITDKMVEAEKNIFKFDLSDYKGLSGVPLLDFGGENFVVAKCDGCLVANVALPKDAKVGDSVNFGINMDVKGTECIKLRANATETTINISSSYPHPCFIGKLLPTHREVGNDGFKASWKVLDINTSDDYCDMGVKFVEPANPYQQSMRSAKYGILIIILVFVAGMFVEFLTRKEISPIQYAVIGLSLILFYALLIAFSEFILFAWAYFIAALMTVCALVFYFRAILKSSSSYILGGFLTLVYALNYVLLQMETYALLAGSLVFFVLLCAVMYLTANINNTKTELPETE